MRKKGREKADKKTLLSIQQSFFRTQLALILALATFLAAAGILLNLYTDTQKSSQNLQNVAETIAHSLALADEHGDSSGGMNSAVVLKYLDSLKRSLSDIDIISIVSAENIRLYHSNHDLIGTAYDGTLPAFGANSKLYVTNDIGPSGIQRRAYAAIYSADGSYGGFVIAVMLMDNIREETVGTLATFALITLIAILIELLISIRQSKKIKGVLLGYEPDTFSAMYKIRDNILETLDEGIIAVDSEAKIQFINHAAAEIFEIGNETDERENGLMGKPLKSMHNETFLTQTLKTGEKEFGVPESAFPNADILVDRIPIMEGGLVTGAVGILHNRTEYTKLMEDITGAGYLVDAMRANNHEFTNKLHIILGLIQIGMYDEAISYIENVTLVQRETISKIAKAINEPSVAALLIGKIARASELNIKFIFREDSSYSKADISLPAEALVTIIGNLIDNSLDAMNVSDDGLTEYQELIFGMYSSPGALLITIEDTGAGIPEENRQRIFEQGFSTKGTGRGTGLCQVKKLVDGFGGTVSLESQEGIGTAFTVSFKRTR